MGVARIDAVGAWCDEPGQSVARGLVVPLAAASTVPQTHLGNLAAHHAQLRGRRGEAKAIGATRQDILVAYFHIVRDRVPFRELGLIGSASASRPSIARGACSAQIEALGLQVTISENRDN